MKMQEERKEELIRCSVCDVYIGGEKGFTCPRCRRSPLCKSHRVPGRRECASCVYEMQKKDLNDLKTQEYNLKSFLKLLQFLFIVFAIFFIAMKTGIPEVLDLLQSNIITSGLKYLGGLSVAGYVLFYAMLFHQRQRISALEIELSNTEFRRMIK